MILKIVLASAVVVLCAWFVYGNFFQPHASDYMTKTVTIGGNSVLAQVADTEPKRELGLSNRDNLPEGQGMLFVFDAPGYPAFWMKDMRFSIDMLFADASGTIVSIYKVVSPVTYTQSPPQIFKPTSPALYVLEVPAGYADAHGVVAGMKMSLQK